jgi:hypothetical protein
VDTLLSKKKEKRKKKQGSLSSKEQVIFFSVSATSQLELVEFIIYPRPQVFPL